MSIVYSQLKLERFYDQTSSAGYKISNKVTDLPEGGKCMLVSEVMPSNVKSLKEIKINMKEDMPEFFTE